MSTPGKRVAGHWSNEREHSRLWLLRLMRWVAVHAGRPAARSVLQPVALYFLLVNGRARRASTSYLARVLRRPVSWRGVLRHFHYFAATVLDRIYFLQESFDHFEITSSGVEGLHALLESGDGLMLIGAHFGSFEALRADAQGRGARVAMLMFEDNAKLINATLAAVAPKAQLHTIALGRAGAMLALRGWLDAGGLAGLLADRTLPGAAERSRLLRFDFLGTPANFSDGPFRLAALLRRPVVFMAGIYRGGNRYELRFERLDDFRLGQPDHDLNTDQRVRRALIRYVTLLETLCIEAPYNWFNFFDFWDADALADVADAADAPPR